MRGKFITLEGGEGVGKSTNLLFIKERLEAAGKKVVVTREPGGTEIGEEVRSILLAHRESSLHETTELLLMFAARAQHLQQLILPALDAGDWVLCDRFTDATYAYQGGGRNLPFEKIKILEDFVQNGLKPDCTFLLDAPIEIGMQRASERGELDRFETEEQQFFHRVRAAYQKLAKLEEDRFHLINASQSLTSVQSEISSALDQLLVK
ncbi:MAG TPA: dTMP kinase [Thermodesulforhabdus norvegica]|uniref:Thymidylate kinase n=1 Tax=Thermodesulforhabdus norvegica TaxID=39841 RepID=A0A7C1ALJ0_9BACT|nr:MAG: dTMP kinase [Gammaproteobacteria bacterium]RLA23316.1 MAG: dTMP kinase [Gammaproteobacteria bacterium]HDL89827.1 dTMP kinase [Thermodesulforhabdus norvegica]